MAQAPAHPLIAAVFTDHAVLQRDRPIAVWGWAAPRDRVTVSLGEASVQARADAQGLWRATLPAHAAGGPLTLSARARSGLSESLSDILIGDVFLCSGQSNMEFTTRYASNAATTLGQSADGQLRLLHIPKNIATAPQTEFGEASAWRLADSQSVGEFSAVCYFFGREMRRTQNVPVGLIDSTWGGTIIQAWMSDDSLHRMGRYETELSLVDLNRRDPAAAHAQLRNSMNEWWRANDPGTRANWFAPGFDDASWRTVAPEGFWESAGVPALVDFDGVVWFRTEFTLTAAQAAQGGQFTLGPADDIDATYLNGQQIGATSGWDTPRVYSAPAGALHEGRNVLALAVLDTGGGGGWWGPASDKALHLADGTNVALSTPWRYQIAAPLAGLAPAPRAPWDGPNGDTVLFNGMIAPLAPYGLKAVLWYQGEANAGAPDEYAHLMPAWMENWRQTFATPRLPFLVVQLANYGKAVRQPQSVSWGAIRDVQRRAVEADANAGLAVIIDVGDRYELHPTQKLMVGERLGLLARRRIYGEAVEDSGPTPIAAHRVGASVVVSFAHAPLVVYSNRRPNAFELCDAAGACRFVDAIVDGGDSVRLDTSDTPNAASVRYCWGDAPICNLYNDADLPATPFQIAIN